MKTIKVRIPVIVTADCRWATAASHQETEPDWKWIDEMCDHDNPTLSPRKLWVEAELPVPDDSVQTIQAEAVVGEP